MSSRAFPNPPRSEGARSSEWGPRDGDSDGRQASINCKLEGRRALIRSMMDRCIGGMHGRQDRGSIEFRKRLSRMGRGKAGRLNVPSGALKSHAHRRRNVLGTRLEIRNFSSLSSPKAIAISPTSKILLAEETEPDEPRPNMGYYENSQRRRPAAFLEVTMVRAELKALFVELSGVWSAQRAFIQSEFLTPTTRTEWYPSTAIKKRRLRAVPTPGLLSVLNEDRSAILPAIGGGALVSDARGHEPSPALSVGRFETYMLRCIPATSNTRLSGKQVRGVRYCYRVEATSNYPGNDCQIIVSTGENLTAQTSTAFRAHTYRTNLQSWEETGARQSGPHPQFSDPSAAKGERRELETDDPE
ncbi:hypothetical protein B0H11DRAFT_2416116 [Mycena galericulata]|nr:hypothetical protein B0H11DRAFT_2416116 [Mycena galericulata]